jgi:hypothetical protein
LAVQWAARGHQVRVLTNHFPRGLAGREVREGITVERSLFLSPQPDILRRERLDLWLAGLVVAPLTRRRLNRLVREFQPDVLNLHFPDVMIPFVQRLRRAHRFRLVVSWHGHDLNRFVLPQTAPVVGSRQALGRLLQEADAVTACSPWLLEQPPGLSRPCGTRGRQFPTASTRTDFRTEPPTDIPAATFSRWGD